MKWIFPPEHKANLIDTLFTNRAIVDKDKFLNPKLSDLNIPFELFGVEKAAIFLEKAIKEKKKIYIHGDFDVDGITATSLMWNFLYRDVGANVIPFIPNRFTDGYGLSEENIKKIVEDGGEVIITVDCGIKDIELVEKYSEKIDFIITDHHTIRSVEEKKLKGSAKVGNFLISSSAKAVVHPQLSENLALKEVCGAFVSWKVCCGLNEHLGLGIDMSKYLDMVALGTVCDVMPLIDENRVVVRLGLEKLKNTQNEGLKALFKVAAVDIKECETYHLGFVIGPRLNASGRLESAMDAVRLLTTQSPEYALKLARKLNDLNTSRQELTKKYIDIAEGIVLERGLDEKLYFIYGDEWPEGIVGLIAGRLTEKYNRPFIIGSSKDGIIKASARSIESFNIATALRENSEHLLRYGGHSQAAGLSLSLDRYDDFLKSLQEYASTNISDSDLEKSLKIEFLASESDLNIESAKDLAEFEPFGSGNPAPMIALLSLVPKNIKVLGKDQSHLKFLSESGSNLEFLFFGYTNKFKDLLYSAGKRIDIAGNLSVDSWNGREKVVFKIKEARLGN